MLAFATADFKERARRFSFIAMTGIALFLAFCFVPNPEAAFRTLIISSETYLQASNPTWVPIASAICTGMVLPIFGFSYVKGVVGSDRENGVMELMQACGASRVRYLFGKFVSSSFLLFSLCGIVAAGSLVMIVLRYPGQGIAPWAFVSPFLAILPGLVFTAAVAVFFETLPCLRTKGGSVLGVFLFLMLFVVVVSNVSTSGGGLAEWFDFSGYTWIHDSIVAAAGDDVRITVLGGGARIKNTGTQELRFVGLQITVAQILQKLVLVTASVSLVFASAIFLEKRPLKQKMHRYSPRLDKFEKSRPKQRVQTEWVQANGSCFSLLRQTVAEGYRLSRALPFPWIAAICGIWLVTAFAPYQTACDIMLPLLYGLAILPLARLGSQEVLCGVTLLLGTINGGRVRQAVASCLVGVAFSCLLSFPLLLRAFAAGNILGAIALLAFAVLVPLVAFALGRKAKSPRVFETLFVLLLYFMLSAPGTVIPLVLK